MLLEIVALPCWASRSDFNVSLNSTISWSRVFDVEKGTRCLYVSLWTEVFCRLPFINLSLPAQRHRAVHHHGRPEDVLLSRSSTLAGSSGVSDRHLSDGARQLQSCTRLFQNRVLIPFDISKSILFSQYGVSVSLDSARAYRRLGARLLFAGFGGFSTPPRFRSGAYLDHATLWYPLSDFSELRKVAMFCPLNI